MPDFKPAEGWLAPSAPVPTHPQTHDATKATVEAGEEEKGEEEGAEVESAFDVPVSKSVCLARPPLTPTRAIHARMPCLHVPVAPRVPRVTVRPRA